MLLIPERAWEGTYVSSESPEFFYIYILPLVSLDFLYVPLFLNVLSGFDLSAKLSCIKLLDVVCLCEDESP